MSLSRLCASLALLLLCGTAALADELVLKNGERLEVRRMMRFGDRVRFELADGRVREVPASEVASPPLDQIPERAAPAPSSPPPPPPAPVETGGVIDGPTTLELKGGERIEVKRAVVSDGRVRFETLRGEVREVPVADVVAPPVERLPILMRLASGERLTVRRVARRGDRVRFETMGGEVREVPGSEVVSPAPDTLVAIGPTPPPPTPAPPVEPVPDVVPTPAPPVEVAKASEVPDFVVVGSRWDLFDDLLAGRTDDELAAMRMAREGRGPYGQNRLKGDKPIAGEDLFLVLTASLDTIGEARRVPLPSGVFAEQPDSTAFFGRGGQLFAAPKGVVSAELFRGQTAFRPRSWAVKLTGAYSENVLHVKERGVVNVDPRESRTRNRRHLSLEEAFGEVKLRDLSPHYDFVSARAGIQPFVSDFRGLVFSDFNLGARVFGNAARNRWQYNLAFFDLLEKETNSELNTFEKRDQRVLVANVYRQDTFRKGYTASFSYHRSADHADEERHYDENGFLVRPARIGTPRLHRIDTNYLGWAGDGHLGRFNVSHALYYAFGHDDGHALEGEMDVRSTFFALEVSRDDDWTRSRVAFVYASGDGDVSDGTGGGFDAIYDNPNFAGGPFSFWVRSGIPLTQTAVLLKAPNSLLPSLRSNKFEGQASHVNPGLFLLNLSADAEVTPKLKAVLNMNLLRFHRTEALEALLFQPDIGADIGLDVGLGVVWRPDLSENVVVTGGLTGLLSTPGFWDLYSSPCFVAGCELEQTPALYNAFVQIKLTY
jgi:hypothetical protein